MTSDLSFFTSPYDHEALTRELHTLADTFPSLNLFYLGDSLFGRSIPGISIGRGRRSVLYVGAHHGTEWLTSALLTQLARELAEAEAADARIGAYAVRTLLETHTYYIFPMLNPDGVEYAIHGINEENPLYERLLEMNGGADFSHWQANGRGVDLNHNYDAGFSEYKQWETEAGLQNGAPTRYSGENPESEPETARLCNFIRYQDALCGVISLHTQGEEIFTRPLTRASSLSARRLSELCAYPVSEASGPAAYGGLTDWCIQALRIPAFTFECGRGVNPLPIGDAPSIYRRIRTSLISFPALL